MTLTTLPLFPLSTVLFPDGLLPLQIFELRYLNMVKKCIADGTEFGVVAQTLRLGAVAESQTTSEANAPALPMSQETFTTIGTSAKIVSHFVPQPGLIRIDCVGGQRFSIVSTQQQTGGLWVAQVQTIEADLLIPVPAELLDAVTALRQVALVQEVRAAQAARDQDQAAPALAALLAAQAKAARVLANPAANNAIYLIATQAINIRIT